MSLPNTPPSPTSSSVAQDAKLPADAEDTISAVSWSPTANHLAAASWDGKVRVYDVNANSGTARGAAMLAADGPLFDCDWAKDGTLIVAAGADRKCHVLHLPTGQKTTIGSHGSPIRNVRFVDIPGTNGPIMASGSWDKTVKFWDLRQQDPLGTLNCSERVYSMDSKSRLLVVATAECRIHLVDLSNPTVISRSLKSQIPYQTKAVAAFPNGDGWATATIGGRCAVGAVNQAAESDVNLVYKCHRSPYDAQRRVTKVWSVNDVRVHPLDSRLLATGGSDGGFSFWDRVARSRTSSYPSSTGGRPVTATAFNGDGGLYAYALGYDWSFGCGGNDPGARTELMLHRVCADDVTAKIRNNKKR